MYRTLLGVSATVAIVTLSACNYQKTVEDTDYIGIKKPDGTFELTVRKRSTNTTIKIEGDSIRELKKLAPLPNADLNGVDVEVYYRYEYRFDVFDTSGNFVETIAVATLEDFVEMIPLAFQLGGLDVPFGPALDTLVADAAANWISPYTHWMLHN